MRIGAFLSLIVTVFPALPAAAEMRHDQRYDLFSVANFPLVSNVRPIVPVQQAYVFAPRGPAASYAFYASPQASPGVLGIGNGYSTNNPLQEIMMNDYTQRTNSYNSLFGPSPTSNFLPSLSTGSPSGGGAASIQAANGRCQPIPKDPKLIDEVKNHPTAGQLACRNRLPSRPTKVVYGFSGLMGDYWMKGSIEGMTGGSPVHFEYYPHHEVSDQYLMDSARCAYEFATHPYELPNGRRVYNTMSIMGHSFGGDAAHRLAAILAKLGVATDMVVTADARQPDGPFCKPTWGKPCMVARWFNYWEPSGGILGLPGFPISGAKNFYLPSEDHMSIYANQDLRENTKSALDMMPSARPSYEYSVYNTSATAEENRSTASAN